MKKLESTWYNMAVVLTLISVIAGAALAWVNELTKDPIALIQEQKEEKAIKAVLCDDDVVITDTVKNGDVVVYVTESGAAVKTADPQNGSFGGGLTVMVGLDREFHVLGYTVLESHETPGLGAKASDWFQKGGKGDIIGRKAGNLATTKDNGEIDAITASTITSRAFLRAVNNACAEYAKVQNAQVDVHTSASAVNKENVSADKKCASAKGKCVSAGKKCASAKGNGPCCKRNDKEDKI